MFSDPQWLMQTAWLIVPFIISLTIHEYAHARTALAFGDPTARNLGRCTLNPLAHLELFGMLALVFTHFIGWAKPVPVNPLNLRPRRLGDAMVSLAGPMSNLALAVICGVFFHFLYHSGHLTPDDSGRFYVKLLWSLMLTNLGLCVFNLIPLFPLDGHHILREILPEGWHQQYMYLQMRFGLMLLLILVFAPNLIGSVTKNSVFDPISWLFDKVVQLALGILF